MSDRGRVVHNFLNEYLRILVSEKFEIEVYSVGPLDKGGVPFTLRASGPAEVRISGKVYWSPQVDPLSPVPEMLGTSIQVGPESNLPVHTVEPYFSLYQGQFQVSAERFVNELRSKIAELKSGNLPISCPKHLEGAHMARVVDVSVIADGNYLFHADLDSGRWTLPGGRRPATFPIAASHRPAPGESVVLFVFRADGTFTAGAIH